MSTASDYSLRRLTLRLRHPFRLAHGTSTTRQNVLLELRYGELCGLGEAAIVPYYPFSAPQVEDALHQMVSQVPLADIVRKGVSPEHLPEVRGFPPPARAALDMALFDLWGKAQGSPLFSLWGLEAEAAPPGMVTVAMDDDPQGFQARVAAAADQGMVKLKMGSPAPDHDLRLARWARDAGATRLCADANGGWSVEQAARLIPQLAAWGFSFVEQPLAPAPASAWKQLRALLPPQMPPLIADESFQGIESLEPLIGLADGVNIKLAKAGGLAAARRFITAARRRGLRVLLGCMVETSLAVTAAAQLAPLADYTDLDGHLLIANDPFQGVNLKAGRVVLPDEPGLGVRWRNS